MWEVGSEKWEVGNEKLEVRKLETRKMLNRTLRSGK